MRILLVHERFPPDFGGGGEDIVFETARGLRERGVEVQVLTTGDPAADCFEGVPVTRLPISRYRLNLAVRAVSARARQADLIHACTYHACLPAWLAARLSDKPVVAQVLALFDEAWSGMKGPWLGPAFRLWERFLVKRSYSRLLFLSEFSREQAVRMGVSRARAVVVPPGIRASDFFSAEPKEDVVLFVGKLDERKGVDDVLAAARALPGVRFRMVGWGPQEAALRAQAPANLEIAGFLRGAPLREALARARIFLLPTRAETLGLAVVEAMASGCAVVSTAPVDFEGIRVAAGDRPAVIGAVKRLWEDRNATRAMGTANVALAQRYDWSGYLDRLLETYRQVLEEPPARGR